MTDELKSKVQTQFGASAADYATSDIHARGESLGVLLEFVQPQTDWHALDVATGAGHTALMFAPLVAEMTACDLTPQMLRQTESLAEARGVANLSTQFADAESLPFDDSAFDLVTCRLAFHHFPHPEQALAEFARVLRPGGVLALTDNYTVEDEAAAAYYNAYEKLRDPSHFCVHRLSKLRAMIEAAGFALGESRELTKEFEFHAWADRQRVSDDDKQRLLDMMRAIPPALQSLFHPRWADGTMYFSLAEVVLVARTPTE